METAHLREYVQVAQCGSFTAAARELHMTQSALSKHVAVLEREFGVDLFVRDRSGVKLTQAGKVLYAQALAIERTLEHTHALLRASEAVKRHAGHSSEARVTADAASAVNTDCHNTALRCKCRRAAQVFGLSGKEAGALVLYLEERGFAAIQGELGLSRDEVAEVLGGVYRKLGVHDKQEALDFIYSVSE